MRCRRVWSCWRDSPNAHARRAVGSPVAIPRRNSTRVAERCWVFANTVPDSSVLSPIAGPTAVGRKVTLCAEQTPRSVPTVGAGQPLRVEVTFQPAAAEALVHELGDRELNHAAIIADPTRWLHMSRRLLAIANDLC
jgi:hypothetical protein